MRQPLTDLFLEVASGVLVCVGEEVQDTVTDAVVLEVVHHVGAVALGGWGGVGWGRGCKLAWGHGVLNVSVQYTCIHSVCHALNHAILSEPCVYYR